MHNSARLRSVGALLRRRLGIVIAIIAVALFLSATRIAVFLTELWWFESVGYRPIFLEILFSQVGLGSFFGLVLAVLVAANLVVARRLRPVVLPASPREAVIERYRQLAEPYVPWLILGVALLFAISAGGAVASQWDAYLLWRHGGPFGFTDPQFQRDVGFYVFDLPWLGFVQGWLFTSLVLTLLVTAVAHYLLGSIRPEAPRDRVTLQARAHLSVLLALVLAAHGWGYWLDRFELNFSPRGQVTGASYTDINAELPALNLLLVVTAVAILLVLVNIRRRGWLLPGVAIALLVFFSVVLQGIYPEVIQRLRVAPQELPREQPFIERNLAATRSAYGLDAVEGTRFSVQNDLGPPDAQENAGTFKNVRLWDPDVLETTYKQLQAIRLYYDFEDVDVDRYMIDGELRQVMVAARELNTEGLERARTWQNLHVTYTHGYGVVSSLVNTSSPEGQPVFLARDIPPRGDAESLLPSQPAVYYGEVHDDYSLVRTSEQELDFEDSATGAPQMTEYAAEGGVPIGGVGRRLAFALRYGDPNLVLSEFIDGDSAILFHRTVRDRVRQVAPFLVLDNDPYSVVVDGRILWVIDAYTTSAYYPYSERREFPANQRTVNYVRNSVKAVVDAYDGSVTLYVVDPTDPILQAWQGAFPEPFAPAEEAPPGLAAHFRYPEDLFSLQADVFTTYHIPDAPAFYSKADAWDIPPDAAFKANNPASQDRPMQPYYLLMRLPGQPTEEFVLIQPYLARSKPNMIAWLAARSDPGHYGQLYTVQFPSDQAILGPAQAQATIEQDPVVSEYITLRDQRGSRVIRGNLIIIPVEDSILYLEPLFLENPQARIPELGQVVAILGDRVVMDETFDAALAKLLGTAPPPRPRGPGPQPPPTEPGAEPPSPEVAVDQLLSQALERFAAAEAALREGDLAGYQRNIEEARALLQRAAQVRGVTPAPPGRREPAGPGGSPSPGPLASG